MTPDASLPTLANFEDDDTPPPTLTPRRQRPNTPSDPTSPTIDDGGDGESPEPASPAAPTMTRPAAARRGGRGRPLSDPVSQTATGFIRPSNVLIPARLLTPIKVSRTQLGLTTGELIITALEATADQLGELLSARPVTGGALFTARPASTSVNNEPQSSLNFRMRVEDFAILDSLVERFGAASRSQLVTVALAAYLESGGT